MPIYDVRSISQVGTTEPFELQLARGQIPNHSFVHKFGAVPSMSINTSGTVWDVDDTAYPWSAFSTAGTLSVARASASDANKVITIIGLDANYNEVSENVTLTNASGNVTSQSFLRVFRAFMHDTSDTNVGTITVTKSATTVLQITAGKGQTLMAIYTVPAGCSAYITKGKMTVQSGADATGNLFVRYGGQTAFRIAHSFEVSDTYQYDFSVPVKIPEKSDIDVRASVRSNNARVTAAFDMILIKETGSL